jgi:hypothetical protein
MIHPSLKVRWHDIVDQQTFFVVSNYPLCDNLTHRLQRQRRVDDLLVLVNKSSSIEDFLGPFINFSARTEQYVALLPRFEDDKPKYFFSCAKSE